MVAIIEVTFWGDLREMGCGNLGVNGGHNPHRKITRDFPALVVLVSPTSSKSPSTWSAQ